MKLRSQHGDSVCTEAVLPKVLNALSLPLSLSLSSTLYVLVQYSMYCTSTYRKTTEMPPIPSFSGGGES